MMEYKVICNVSLSELEDDVRLHLKHGWKTRGGIAVRTMIYGDDLERTLFAYQAITRGAWRRWLDSLLMKE